MHLSQLALTAWCLHSHVAWVYAAVTSLSLPTVVIGPVFSNNTCVAECNVLIETTQIIWVSMTVIPVTVATAVVIIDPRDNSTTTTLQQNPIISAPPESLFQSQFAATDAAGTRVTTVTFTESSKIVTKVVAYPTEYIHYEDEYEVVGRHPNPTKGSSACDTFRGEPTPFPSHPPHTLEPEFGPESGNGLSYFATLATGIDKKNAFYSLSFQDVPVLRDCEVGPVLQPPSLPQIAAPTVSLSDFLTDTYTSVMKIEDSTPTPPRETPSPPAATTSAATTIQIELPAIVEPTSDPAISSPVSATSALEVVPSPLLSTLPQVVVVQPSPPLQETVPPVSPPAKPTSSTGPVAVPPVKTPDNPQPGQAVTSTTAIGAPPVVIVPERQSSVEVAKPSPLPSRIVFEGQTIVQNSQSVLVINDKTIAPEAPVTIGTGPRQTVVQVQTNSDGDRILFVGSVSSTIDNPPPTPAAPTPVVTSLNQIVLEGSTFTADASTRFTIDDATLTPGGPAVTITQPSTTAVLSLAPNTGPTAPPVLIINNSVTSTLTPVAVTVTPPSTPFAAPTPTSALIIDDTTVVITPAPDGSSTLFLLGSTTLTPGETLTVPGPSTTRTVLVTTDDQGRTIVEVGTSTATIDDAPASTANMTTTVTPSSAATTPQPAPTTQVTAAASRLQTSIAPSGSSTKPPPVSTTTEAGGPACSGVHLGGVVAAAAAAGVVALAGLG